MGKKEINTTWKALPIRSVAFFFYLNIYENIGTFFNVCIRCTAGFSLFAGRGTSRFSEGWKNEIDHYLQQDSRVNRTAANILRLFVERISGADMPVVTNKTARKGDVIIGSEAPKDVKEDGYALSTAGGILKISGKANGVVYGAVSLLEDYLGIDYWGENEYSLTKSENISLPLIER